MLAPMTSRAKVREAMSDDGQRRGFEQPEWARETERAGAAGSSYDYGDIQHTRTNGAQNKMMLCRYARACSREMISSPGSSGWHGLKKSYTRLLFTSPNLFFPPTMSLSMFSLSAIDMRRSS